MRRIALPRRSSVNLCGIMSRKQGRKADQIWNAFWSGGVSNSLSVIEQITYLPFIKRLDDLHTLEENKAANLNIAMERRIFPDRNDDQGRS